MNKCYICGSKLEKEHTNIARYWGNKLVALENVPTLICTQCGERYFEAKVSQKIDEKIQEALSSQEKASIALIHVPVLQF